MATAIVWFRSDLRLADNPALKAALELSERLVPVFILAPEEEGAWPTGSASRWWLHHSLTALDDSLRRLGSRLIIRRGASLDSLRRLMHETGAVRVSWNRRYEPAAIERDREIKQFLRQEGLVAESFNGSLLYEPWAVMTGDGGPYKVFTPFWKALQKRGLGPSILSLPEAMPPVPDELAGMKVDELGLLPKIPWYGGLRDTWVPGEAGALARLDKFVNYNLDDYGLERDMPDHAGTSGLSPHLHFGEISPRQILVSLQSWSGSHGERSGADSFIRELAWREFAHHLLFHFPHTPDGPLDERFEKFSWNSAADEQLQAWRKGMTGIPLVDAGMRELWHTGWMHNRVRMVAASLLVKNLRVHWLEGARWFWDTLVDADLANNTLGWQWVAGCGADAAPYFRIFNPVSQGERFDPSGDYVRSWVPELRQLPASHIHRPWMAPSDLLEACGVRLGGNYPHPIVDLKTSRQRALAAFQQLARHGGSG